MALSNLLATGSQTQVTYGEQTTFGGIFSGTPKTLRIDTETLELTRGSIKSAEITSNRQIRSFRLGQHGVIGDSDFELTYGDFDDFIQAALGGTWATRSTTVAHTDVTVALHTYTSAGLVDFVAAGFLVGDEVTVAGYTTVGNNGVKHITGVATNVLTVSDTLSVEVSGDSVTFTSRTDRVKAGTTKRAFTVEVGATDIAQYEQFIGTTIDKISLDLKPKGAVKGKWSFMGQTMGLSGSSIGAPTPASTNEMMDTFSGTFLEGGSTLAEVTGMTMNLNNDISMADVLMSKFSEDYFPGDIDVTGTLDVWFKDAAMYNKFINETSSSIAVKMQGIPTNKTLLLGIPFLKYTKAKKGVTTTKGFPLQLEWQALYDATTGTNIYFDRSNPID